MATFSKLKSGSWRVQIRRKGHYASQTFRARADSNRWAKEVERQIDAKQPEAEPSERQVQFVAGLIDLHVSDMRAVGRAPLRSKTYCLDQLRRGLGHYKVEQLTREALIDFGKRRALGGAGPVTLSIDIGYIRTVFLHAEAVHGHAVSLKTVEQARFALKRLGLIGKGRERTRRPEKTELNKLFQHFDANLRLTTPMSRIVKFAIATGMRQNEICRIAWSDVDPKKRTALIRNRKHPREKLTNDQTVALVVDAGWDPIALVEEQWKGSAPEGLIFPFNSRSIGTAFRRACQALGIEDLHFHDLRHETASRLFEAGYQIPEVSLVTGHKDWKMLQRYTNLKPEDLADRTRTDGNRGMPKSSSRRMLRQADFAPIRLANNDNCS